MDDAEVEADGPTAGINSYYIRRNRVWAELNTESFTIGGHEASLMVVQGDKLVMLERDQASRILRNGEGLMYVPVHTRKREYESRIIKKPRRKKNKYRMEPLLEELNSHMALMNKILLRQWADSSKIHVKEIPDQNPTQHVEPRRNIAVSAEVHEKPAAIEASPNTAPNSHNVDRTAPSSPKSTLAGKKREFVVSPGSLRAISKFSQKHLDIIQFRGRNSVSPDTFDKDDDYCRTLLHKLNPVVELERSLMVDKIIKKAQRALEETTGQKLPLTRFAATLGLVGAEKKKFMSDILDHRRRMRRTLQKDNEEADEFMTDSSAVDLDLNHVSGSKKSEPSKKKTEAAKRKKMEPKRTAKRFKSASTERSFSLPCVSLSSGDNSDSTPKKSHKKKLRNDGKHHDDKENRKKVLTESKANNNSNSNSEDEMIYVKKSQNAKITKTQSETKPFKRNRVLRSANSSKPSKTNRKEVPNLNKSSSATSISLEKSPLKRPDLERVVKEDTSTVISKQTKITRTGEVTPEKSLLSLKKRPELNKSTASQDNSKLMNSTQNSSIKFRVYTMLEDCAIIDFVLKDDNQRLVKGTLMWKILQKCFHSLTKQSRTWQSLKNRYLKYILPNLKNYSLSYEKEKLLRSGEYLGEISRKKKSSKENSIFKALPVVSASNALRGRGKPKDADRAHNAEAVPSTSKAATDRPGPTSSTPLGSPRRPAPTYSELTRRFLRRRPPASTSDSEDDFEATAKTGMRKLFTAKP